MNLEVTNTGPLQQWTYRAHPKDANGNDSTAGVVLVASVVSGDGSVVQDPAAPLDVQLKSGPSGADSVFSIKGAGNVVDPAPEDVVTMHQVAVPPPPPGPAASLNGELIGPSPQQG